MGEGLSIAQGRAHGDDMGMTSDERVTTDIRVEVSDDGWDIYSGGRRYHWNHNEPDLGTNAIAVLLQDLGHHVKLIEVC